MSRGKDVVGSVYAYVGGEDCPSRETFVAEGERGQVLKRIISTTDVPVTGAEVVPGRLWGTRSQGFTNRVETCGSCVVGAEVEVCPMRYTIEQMGIDADAAGIPHISAAAVDEQIRREEAGEYDQ